MEFPANYTDQQAPCWSLVSTGGVQREKRERERLNIQQATEANWLTRAQDFKCTDLSKTQLPSYAPVIRYINLFGTTMA
jgi:hypothetical protein